MPASMAHTEFLRTCGPAGEAKPPDFLTAAYWETSCHASQHLVHPGIEAAGSPPRTILLSTGPIEGMRMDNANRASAPLIAMENGLQSRG